MEKPNESVPSGGKGASMPTPNMFCAIENRRDQMKDHERLIPGRDSEQVVDKDERRGNDRKKRGGSMHRSGPEVVSHEGSRRSWARWERISKRECRRESWTGE